MNLLLGSTAVGTPARTTPINCTSISTAAVNATVLAITVVALSLAKVPVFNNVLGFFLGLVTYFASHLPPSLWAFAELALAAAAFLAHALQKRIHHDATPEPAPVNPPRTEGL